MDEFSDLEKLSEDNEQDELGELLGRCNPMQGYNVCKLQVMEVEARG
jgi:hypothetical protein